MEAPRCPPAAAAAAPEALAVVQAKAEVEAGDAKPHAALKVEELFICPITQELMRDPVMAEDGHTYERAAITTWLRSHDTSPATGLPLTCKVLVPNLAVKAAAGAAAGRAGAAGEGAWSQPLDDGFVDVELGGGGSDQRPSAGAAGSGRPKPSEHVSSRQSQPLPPSHQPHRPQPVGPAGAAAAAAAGNGDAAAGCCGGNCAKILIFWLICGVIITIIKVILVSSARHY